MLSNILVSRIIKGKFNNNKWGIIVKGYDKYNLNNKNIITKSFTFVDYMYYPVEDIEELQMFEPKIDIDYNKEYITLDDKKVYKVYINDYYFILKDLKINYPLIYDKTYSFDIPPETKFALDNNIQWSKKRHICYFDIETYLDKDDPYGNKPENARSPITSIQLYSNLDKEYYIFAWHPEQTRYINDNSGIDIKIDKSYQLVNNKINYIYCKDEISLINAFIYLVQEKDFDLFTGWFSQNYDLPYIINRCEILGFDLSVISPVGVITCYFKNKDNNGESNEGKWIASIKGIDHLDMMECFHDLNITLKDNKLDTAAKELLGENINKIKDINWQHWLSDFAGFMKYGLRDVEILQELDNKLKIFDTYITLQEISNIISLNNSFSKSIIVENYAMTDNWNDIIFPNHKNKIKQKYMGAYVANPVSGLHRNIAVLDFASLYPTIIMAYNLSPETFLFSQLDLELNGVDIEDKIKELNDKNIKYIDTGYDEELFGKRYIYLAHESKVGMFPKMIRTLFLSRKEDKKCMKGLSCEDDDYVALDKRQYVKKILMNSNYGANGFPSFRFYTPEIADTITYFARKSIHFANKHFKDYHNMINVYGDTDSTFVALGITSDIFLNSECDKISQRLKDELVSQHNHGLIDKYFMMELEHEKTLTYLYLGEKKKRYYGIDDKGKKYIKGINIIRKDCPDAMVKILDELAEKAVKDELTPYNLEDILTHIQTLDYEHIGVYKKFNKSFEDYTKSNPQHLKAAMFANNILGTSIDSMDRPLLFYIKSKCQEDIKEKDRDKAICIKKEDIHLINKNKDKFEIDYMTFFDKQVFHPLEEFNLIQSVAWTLEEFKKKHRDFYPAKPPSTKCPICGSSHSTVTIVKKCAKKLQNKMLELSKKIETEEILLEKKEILNNMGLILKYIEEFPPELQ